MPRYLNPPNVPRPSSRFSQAVALSGAYKRVIVSPQTGVEAGPRLAEQMAAALDNVLAVIAAAGCEPRDVVKLTCYCVERGQGALFDGIREARLGATAPACACVEVVGLAQPAALVAIEGEAVQENPPR